MLLGTLKRDDLERLQEELSSRPVEERAARILAVLEAGLCGAEVMVVGVTGRHPRGWWGDGSIGIVLDTRAQEELVGARRTPGHLLVRVRLSRASSPDTTAAAETVVVAIKPVHLRLRRWPSGLLDQAELMRRVDDESVPEVHRFSEHGVLLVRRWLDASSCDLVSAQSSSQPLTEMHVEPTNTN